MANDVPADPASEEPAKAPEPPGDPHRPTEHTGHAPKIDSTSALVKVSIGALGVVYGDIGTSPLYAMRECFSPPHGVARTPENIFGILSLVFWSLTFVVVVKYLVFVLRADNRGEGGTLALLALLSGDERERRPRKAILALIFLGLFGASLLYGDGMITPAISVLSAVEGLGEATHALDRWVVPITCGILLAIFMVQRRGTAKVGAIFGPATFVWFLTIGGIGLPWIVRRPEVLLALNPYHAARFFYLNGIHGFLILGSVVLCITGGEALYADMGHFGKRPIRFAWYAVAFPALLTNYFGQGALLLERGDGIRHTFYGLVSGWMLYPLVAIATVATIVASQAMISGAYSITQQAVQLGYSPRVAIVHTSGSAEGQIYVPEVTAILAVACLTLVLTFRESGKLAAAYGIAVTGTMTITSLLFGAVARRLWRWPLWKVALIVGPFLVVDFAFLGANLVKLTHGGWFPIAIAAVVFTMMTTWKRGRAALGAYMMGAALPLDAFMSDVEQTKPHRVSGSAVFMTSNADGAPPVLLHHYKHNKVLHQQVILLSVQTRHEPEVPATERVEVRDLGHGFWQVTASYGFMQAPSVTEILDCCEAKGLVTQRDDVSYFLGRETLLTSGRSGMARWRKALFAFLSRNARPATHFFRIPPNRVVELGIRVEL
jgi:KUP system potassium uptake protein